MSVVLKRNDLRCCSIAGNEGTGVAPCADAVSAETEGADEAAIPPMSFAKHGRALACPLAPRVPCPCAVEALLVEDALAAAPAADPEDVAAAVVTEGPELETGEELRRPARGTFASMPPTRPVAATSDPLSRRPRSSGAPPSLAAATEAPEQEGVGDDPRPAAAVPLPTGILRELAAVDTA